MEYLTNECATASDIILAGALGGIGGGFGGATLLRHGAKSLTRETGKEWSHGIGRKLIKHIPWKRARKFLNQRGGYNGSWVSPKRHFKHDKYRYPKGYNDWGDRWSPARRFADRIPDWMKASTGSGAAGAGIAGSGDKCGCD